ncbi:MAG: hypothetical protein EOP84_15185, partial [Verrucomicrobiaceae bacterium]
MNYLLVVQVFVRIPISAQRGQNCSAINKQPTVTVSESGQASYEVPLQVPPGIAGLEPKLSLTYMRGERPGPLGIGWSLS